MSYFSQFPLVDYDFNRQGTVQQMVNIFRSVRPQGDFIDNVSLYKKYTIKDGMRPDVLSQKLYGTPDFYWTFFIINDFLHDGLQVWPMSQQVLEAYMEKNYAGKALCFKPEVAIEDNRISQGTRNSVAGILELGELIYGGTSGAIGRLIRKDADLNQIILQDIIPGIRNRDPKTGGNVPVDVNGNPTIVGGDFIAAVGENPGEYLTGSVTQLDSTTLFSLRIEEVYDYAEAPAYYYVKGDPQRRPITNPKGITTSKVYSDLQWDADLQGQIAGYNTNQFGKTVVSNSGVSQPVLYSGGYNEFAGQLQLDGENIENPTVAYVSNRQRVIELNDERSFIKVISPEYITEFIDEFEKLLNV